jgi:GT2 family glycosyltransferase
MPKVHYPDGRQQYLCRLLPSPFDLFVRRFLPSRLVNLLHSTNYELRGLEMSSPVDVPVLSGCFLLVRADVYRRIGGFDERFFLYMEDVDLVRRIGLICQTVFFPDVSIIHAHGRGSYRFGRLFWYHICSAFTYFNKWGWLHDEFRTQKNARILKGVRNAVSL